MEHSQAKGGRRVTLAIAVAVAATVAFASFGGIGLAQSAIGLAQYQYGKKVTICHKGKTIRISVRAWPAHKRHGDTEGACTTARKHGKQSAKSHAKQAKKQQGTNQTAAVVAPGQGSDSGHGKGHDKKK
jgi:hypothetical protein